MAAAEAYIIVQSSNLAELAELVNARLKEGVNFPIGGVSLVGRYYVQAMGPVLFATDVQTFDVTPEETKQAFDKTGDLHTYGVLPEEGDTDDK